MRRYVASSDVCLIQSRLMSPGYAGIGRWVLFDAATRRAFAAAGRDIVPDVVRLMAKASEGATHNELMAALPEVSADKVARLIEVGLLIPEEDAPGEITDTFAALYQRATFDYPFHDYSVPASRQEERALLDSYARLWPAPPSRLERAGIFHPLPRRDLLDGPPWRNQRSLDLEGLAWVLQHSFGPTGEIKTRHVTCIRRTSPSGGARHPAEVRVELPSAIDGLSSGSYVYDVARHGLVRETGAASGAELSSQPVFVVRARVERAMWRYRDLRALRPVLLDVGHIIETLALLLDQVGVSTTLMSASPPATADSTWLNESPVAALVVGEAPSARRTVGPSPARPADDVLTNPAAVLHFVQGQLFGRTV